MRDNVVRIKPLLSVEVAIAKVWERPDGVPRMILVHGEPGQGKSTAVDRASIHHGGLYMRATPVWAPRDLLNKLAELLQIRTKRSMRNNDILEQIMKRLSTFERSSRAVIVIDEFDTVSRSRKLTETVRTIYDITGIPFVLVGMTEIEAELEAIPQFPQRIGQHVHFQGIDFEDAQKIAKERCEIDLTEDIQRHVWQRTNGNVRLLVNELASLEELAAEKGLEALGLDDLEGRQ